MDRIDAARVACEKLVADVERLGDALCTEQDTRVQVVDRMFFEVLGYPREGLKTEEKVGPKFLDYRFVVNDLGRIIVEAKRDGRSLGLEQRQSARHYLLRGSVFDTEAAVEGIEQAINYCGRKNVELACVTNGKEWIVFRGSRLGDGKDTADGTAFVFASLQGVLENFKLFYDLLAADAVQELRYRAFFQEAEGQPIRPQLFKRSLRPPGTANLLEHSNISQDVDRVMASFFRKLAGDQDMEMLRDCFVVTNESIVADKRLVRIADELSAKLKTLKSSSAEELTQLIKRAQESQRNEFVILVGLKGAGKTTFIDRFFSFVLPRKIADQCITIRVDLSTSSGDSKTIVDWLNRKMIEVGEPAVFGSEGPDFDELQGMFYDEYSRRRKGTQQHLYSTNKEQFKISFGEYVERRREDRPHDYIRRMVLQIVKSRHKIPCIVFDNADHFTIEFQEQVFQYARSLYETTLCLILVPITDRTSWQLSREGALQSFDSETLYLPVPKPEAVIQQRIAYIEKKITQEKGQKGAGYFFGRGIELELDDLNKFAGALQSVFISTGYTSRTIEYLANQDVRRSLEIARDLVASPHLRVDELLKSYIAGTAVAIDPKKITRAIIRKRYDIYPTGQHKYVQNIYSLTSEIVTSPLLGLRILQMLRDVQQAGAVPADPFVALEQVYEYFRAMTVEPRGLSLHLEEMLKTGLIWSYDPTITRIAEVKRVELSPAGFQHLVFGMDDWVYMESMLQVSPLLEENEYNRLLDLGAGDRALGDARRVFVDYLIAEDQMYVQVPEHPSYVRQAELTTRLRANAQ